MRSRLSAPVIAFLVVFTGCASDIGGGEQVDTMDDSATIDQNLTFSSSNDAQSNPNDRVVSIHDSFELNVASAKLVDVSWRDDDAKLTVCLVDDITNRSVKCISGRNSSAEEGDSIPFSTKSIWFNKGRNSYVSPGDVSPGTTFSVHMKFETLDGVDRSVTRKFRFSWNASGRNYDVRDEQQGLACGEGVAVGLAPTPMPEQQTNDIHIGCQSAVRVTWGVQWRATTMNGRIATRTGSGNDGSEWHHFQLLNPIWYGVVENVAARLTATSGNPDLYVAVGMNPTLTYYECRPYANGTATENCSSSGVLRFYSVRNRLTTQPAVYQLQLVRGTFPVIN